MRWVIKVGSAVISNPEGGLNRSSIERVAAQVAKLQQNGNEVILVSSGAISAGVGRLGWQERPSDLRMKQSAAAVGQLALMEAYEEVFTRENITPAQILLTREDLLDRQRYLNIRNTLMNLLSLQTIPIINENDSVSTDEIQFGDNDNLSAIVAIKVEADRLVLLSDVPGLYESIESKKVIPVVDRITPELEKMALKEIGSKLSVGGMSAKIQAAKMATSAGVETWISSGESTDILERIHQSDPSAGTRFLSRKEKFASRHAWIAFGRTTRGILVVDDGATRALVEGRKSLLPKGIASIKGNFSMGDTVILKSKKGVEIGRGLVNYNATEVKKIKGHHSKEIGSLLGRAAADEVIHRDNLVLL
ncbi:glutamate 5-kinase [bacterium F11]|nr:glutamate 5-kinase [bacterium F11]